MTKEQRLIELAGELLDNWNAWCNAPGWDNNEYDGVSAAILAICNEALGEQVVDEKTRAANL